MNRKILVFFVITCFWLHASGQENYEVTNLGISEGLSNNSVNAIHQDGYGFIWFGTDDGLDRYDGYSFQVFRNVRGDTSSLIHNRITCMADDSNRNLWVGTKNGISIYHNFSSKFTTPSYYNKRVNRSFKADMEINSILKDDEGGMWVATNNHGLLYKSAGEALSRIHLKIKENNSQLNESVVTMAIDQQQVWFILAGVGLYNYNKITHKLEFKSSLFSNANCLYIDKIKNLWIGADQDLFQYNLLTDQVKLFKNFKEDKVIRITAIKGKSNGEIWVATDGGGVKIIKAKSKETSSILSEPGARKLSSNAVVSLCFDTDGRDWIGTLRGGINLLDKRKSKFKTIYHNPSNPNSLINDFVFSFCEDHSGKIWIGTDGGGISLWDKANNTFTNFTHQPNNPNSLSNNNVTSIVEDKNHQIWIGTFGGGINKYIPSKKSFEHYQCLNEVREDKNIWKLFKDSKNNIWAGTTYGDNYTYKLDRKTNKFKIVDKKLHHIITIAEDNEHAIWFGNEFGNLIKLDSVHQKLISYNFKHPVRALSFDKEGGVWVGVQYTGLVYLNTLRPENKYYTETEGLCNNSVLNIKPDDEGNIWISTFNGISRFNLKTKEFKNFYQTDGLQSNQFNYNAAIKLNNGELLFGGINGFNYFNPKDIKIYRNFPKLLITGLEVLNKPFISDEQILNNINNLSSFKKLTLPYKKAVFTIYFAALEYSAPNKIMYGYFLAGWDKSWSYSKTNRSASYSKLNEGNYVFHLKSTNTEGDWNPEEQLLYLTILPPWYKSWLAYGLYVFCLIGFIVIYNRYRVNQSYLKHELEIGKIKAEKDAELNENKLSFFTNISHEFRTPLTLIINPVKELLNSGNKEDKWDSLKVIYRNSRRLLSLIDQLLLFRKADSDIQQLRLSRFNFSQSCHETFSCFICEAQARNISFHFNSNCTDAELFGDREKVEIVFFNLISNALKFTPKEGEISFSIKENLHELIVEVKDTGPGIATIDQLKLFERFYQVPEKSVIQSGFGIGLYLVKRFLDIHHGNISYRSNEPHGAVFTVSLKKGKAHFGAQSILEDAPKITLIEELKKQSEIIESSIKEKASRFNPLEFSSDKKTILIVDDNEEIRALLINIFKEDYIVCDANNGVQALMLIKSKLPDLIISDVLMKEMDGIELCNQIKSDPVISSIPIILLTASASSEIKLRGIEGGADDYISKPFEQDILLARVKALLRNRHAMKDYFFNEVTQDPNHLNISLENKDFLEKCFEIIIQNILNKNFSIEALACGVGMSHSNLYRKIKTITGGSINEFIRSVRLRKAAEILIYTDCNINEAAFSCGINDIKYFRKHFKIFFGINPSDFVKKHSSNFRNKLKLI